MALKGKIYMDIRTRNIPRPLWFITKYNKNVKIQLTFIKKICLKTYTVTENILIIRMTELEFQRRIQVFQITAMLLKSAKLAKSMLECWLDFL